MSNTSLNSKAWHRLRRNKVAIFGLGVIALAFLTAVFAEQLAPDTSPDANEQILSIAMQPPGFKTLLLRISKPAAQLQRVKLWDCFINGTPLSYQSVPILNYRLKKDSMFATVFYGSERPSVEHVYYYTDVLGIDTLHLQIGRAHV